MHFELTGGRGSSGVLHPVGTSKSFGAGRCDVFEYPNLPCLGELQSVRVGTDGSGLLPGWHLALLVVTHIPTGRVWQFRCVGGLMLRRSGAQFQSDSREAAHHFPIKGRLGCRQLSAAGARWGPQPHAACASRLLQRALPHLPLLNCSCYNWIDRRAHYSRWLTLDCVEQRAVYGGGAKQGSPLGVTWSSTGLPASQLSGGHLAAGMPRQPQCPGSPGTYYLASPAGGSPAGGSGGSPHQLHTKARRSPLGGPAMGASLQWGGGSPPSPSVLRSGSGMPGSPGPLIRARR